MTSARDAELSALLDGALAAPEESALRAELARDPALAARLAQLAQVDAALRALPVRPVPADLRSRLQGKLALGAIAHPALSAIRGGAPARPSRRRAWLAGFSAAAAAAAAALLVVLVDPNGEHDEGLSPASDLAAKRTPDAASAAAAHSATPAPERAAGAPTGLVASAQPDSGALSNATGGPNPTSVATEARPAAKSDPSRTLARADAPAQPEGGEQDLALAAAEPEPRVDGAAASVVAASESLDRAAEIASAPSASEAELPALWIEATDAEAAALGELEPADAGVVAVLEWLGELDELEAGAS